jgi:polyhydroxyalkanoate synthesis regulator phasin
MLDGIRRFLRERFESVSSKRPEDLARSLAQQGQATREQATRIARDVVEWSKKNRELITEVVQREVRHQISRLGVATREEISALRKRVRDLEAERRATESPAEKPGAKKTTATRAVGRKKVSTSKPAGARSGAKKAATRKTDRPAGRG